MEVSNSLYGSMCRLFALVTPAAKNEEDLCMKNCHFVGTELEYETGRRNRTKSNAFKTLFSVHVPESEFTEEQQLQTWIYSLRSAGRAIQADAVESAIEELDRAGSLQSALPILKLFLNIDPLETNDTHQLKHIEAIADSQPRRDLSTLPIVTSSYPTFDGSLFEVPRIDYDKEEPYSLPIRDKLSSTKKLDELDVAHCRLFGALTHPPRSLDYLGISSRTRLTLDIRSAEVETTDKPFIRAGSPNKDEGYSSPSSTIPPLAPVEAYNCWEDLENLCNPKKIRRTWEALLTGTFPKKELPYLTRAPLSVMEHLCRHLEENLTLVDETLPLRKLFKVEEPELRKHLLYLMLGVESELFIYRSEAFRINGSPIIEGISPDCLAEMAEPFLECGRLVRRINRAQWHPTAGKVHDALVTQLHDSLQMLQELMEESMKTRSFADLVFQMKTMLPTIRLMEKLWSWPGWNQQEVGRGVAFLQFMVHQATGTIDDEERRLLTAYFAACSRPFLTYLERWLYRGQCCDPYREFLIRPDFEQLSNQRDRLYWTRGFTLDTIDRSRDPGPFVGSTMEDDALLGLMSDIYICGKTVHLLKLCQAKERIDHAEPALRIGLSLEELGSIRRDCEQYALTSPPQVDFVQPVISLGQVAREAREKKLGELVAQRKEKQAERTAERLARHAVAKAVLDEHLEAKRADDKRKAEEDRLVDLEIMKYHDMVAQREAKEKQRLLNKYARLLGNQDNANTDEPTGEDQLDDVVNANTRLEGKDEENNFIAPIVKPPETISIETNEKKQPSKVTGTKRKTTKRGKTPMTREEIRTKVLKEEFGIDPRYTVEEEPQVSRPATPQETPLFAQQWVGPAPESYPLQFSFSLNDVSSHPAVFKEEEGRPDWLQMSRPCEEEIRDLSLSFFVQRSLLVPVRTQCQKVNRSLMHLLIGPEHRFMHHLEALRRYLFLDDGAFGHSLVSSIGSRLDQLKHIHQLVNVPSMNFILQSALHAVRADELYASRLSFYIKEVPAGSQPQASVLSMEALDGFTLRYRVGWPLNLILTEEVMDDYSQVFSFVLQLRLSAWAMEDVQVNLKSCASGQWLPVHLARHAIYHFVQTLQNYVMNQLLVLSWEELLTELKKRARSLDDLFDVHSAYIRRAKSRLLLNTKSVSLMKIIRDALSLALKFRSLLVGSGYNHSPALQTQIKALAAKFREYAKFLRLVLEKVNDRHQQTHLNELLVKLNFNDYYSSS